MSRATEPTELVSLLYSIPSHGSPGCPLVGEMQPFNDGVVGLGRSINLVTQPSQGPWVEAVSLSPGSGRTLITGATGPGLADGAKAVINLIRAQSDTLFDQLPLVEGRPRRPLYDPKRDVHVHFSPAADSSLQYTSALAVALTSLALQRAPPQDRAVVGYMTPVGGMCGIKGFDKSLAECCVNSLGVKTLIMEETSAAESNACAAAVGLSVRGGGGIGCTLAAHVHGLRRQLKPVDRIFKQIMIMSVSGHDTTKAPSVYTAPTLSTITPCHKITVI